MILSKHYNYNDLQEEEVKPFFTSLSALFFGGVTIGMSYVAPHMGRLLTQVALSISGTAGGPLFGLFSLGIFFPFVNSIVRVFSNIPVTAFHMRCWDGEVAHGFTDKSFKP